MPIIYSKVTSEPAVEPITQAEAKLHLRVDHSDENDLIDILRQAAREMVEQHTNRSMITQTRTIKLDYFPCSEEIRLPFGPVASVTSVNYYDEDEVQQTLSNTLYWVDTNSNIPRIVIKDSWPGTYDMPNAVEIVYSCGYGAAGSSVPRPLRAAMLLILGHLYENREQVGSIKHEIPFGAEVLMGPYVVEQNLMY
jgi:uncharacterized phiE125 gp8 family phage protein